MRRELAFCTCLAACCLVELVKGATEATNPRSNQSIVSSEELSLPANHRLEARAPELNGSLATRPSGGVDEFPFNVDFVDQPDLFEIGQSFFRPTLVSSPHSSGHVELTSNSNKFVQLSPTPDSHTRWSRPLEVNQTIIQVSPLASSVDSFDSSQPAAAATTPKSYIVFDDDEDENASLDTTDGVTSASLQHAKQAANQSDYSEAPPPRRVVDEAVRLAQVKRALDRHLAEQRKLLTLLGRRMDGQATVGNDNRALESPWARSGQKQQETTGLVIRGLVPSNRVVKHPKKVYRKNAMAIHKLRGLAQKARATGRRENNPLNDSISQQRTATSYSHQAHAQHLNPVQFSAPDTPNHFASALEEISAPSPPPQNTQQVNFLPNSSAGSQLPSSAASHSHLLQPLQQKSGAVQHAREEVDAPKPLGRDYYSKLSPSPAGDGDSFASLAGASGANKLYVDLSDDDGGNSGGVDDADSNGLGGDDEPQLKAMISRWQGGNAPVSLNEGRFAGASYNPYEQHLFAGNVLDPTSLQAQGGGRFSAAHKSLKLPNHFRARAPIHLSARDKMPMQTTWSGKQHLKPLLVQDSDELLSGTHHTHFNPYATMAMSEYRPPPPTSSYADHQHHNHHHHHRRPPPPQGHREMHDRGHYELASASYSSSPSKKIIHIHTKEKKGHGKYLWPILGGGLTMLMGFLIISNMLLSIPLLAMGASSLFGHGGYHTQQLVPIYNLSQLRPPGGRRRRRKKRWTMEEGNELQLASKSLSLRDFAFKHMLRRILASLARGNGCRANF